MEDCLFCRIVRGELPAAKVAESETCLAFRDIAPKSPVHVLVIPKVHYASLEEVPDASVFGAMSMLAQQVARQEGVATRGYRCVVNTGEDGGQTVGHLHLHLLGGRAHGWPPG
ncbi:MAG: histidine triad nucleotide-binding protein [Gemmatimonadaceae bacterium]|nr:histidine triad nucleotide-binding protein [Gemmatimonadaceae bacterium]